MADNLERAAGSVTDQSLKGLGSDGKPLTAEQSSKLLGGLLEGVHLTDRILVQASASIEHELVTADLGNWVCSLLFPFSLIFMLASSTFLLRSSASLLRLQALKQNGVEKFSPLGQKFDPNLHSALFQIPDAEKEAGTVVVVTKVITPVLYLCDVFRWILLLLLLQTCCHACNCCSKHVMQLCLHLHTVASHALLFGLLAEWIFLKWPCCTGSRSWCFYTALSII